MEENIGLLTTESNQGGGLHGRFTVELKQVFFEEVQSALRAQGLDEDAQKLEYHMLSNMAGGTSFGGLSVLGMSKFKNQSRPAFATPADLADFIDQEAGTIFPHYSNILERGVRSPRQLTGGLLLATKYSNEPLEKIVKNLIGEDTLMSDIENDILVIMSESHRSLPEGASEAQRSQLALKETRDRFAKSHVARGESTKIDDGSEAHRKDWLVWQVALGTSAAPTYLPGVELTNPHRAERIVVKDGALSGFNDPTLPVLYETSFMYGCDTDSIGRAMFYDKETKKGFDIPHDVVHMHWGTGIYDHYVSYKNAMKNTLLSLKGQLVSSPTQSVKRFSAMAAEESIKRHFNFDYNMEKLPPKQRPDPDLALSTDKQLYLLKEAGLRAAEELYDDIREAAILVAQAYAERKSFEDDNPGKSYKDHLKEQACALDYS